MRETFRIGKIEESVFKYIGLNIVNHKNHIAVSQDEFVKQIQPIPIATTRQSQKTAKLTKEELMELRSVVGQANWVASQTRLDICYDVLELSMCLSRNPEVRHLLQANKMIRKMKSDYYALIFPRMNDISNLQVEVYSDASHANLPDGSSSTGGYIILLTVDDKLSVIMRRSKGSEKSQEES